MEGLSYLLMSSYSSVLGKFHCRGLSLPLFCFSRQLWMQLFFWFVSQHFFCWHIEKVLILICRFCILLLCWKCLIRFYSLLVESSGCFRYRAILSANRDNLTSSFLICIPFSYFSCFIALAKNSSIILNKNGDNWHPYLAPNLRGNAYSFFPHTVQYCL
jgi:hypothetical protein